MSEHREKEGSNASRVDSEEPSLFKGLDYRRYLLFLISKWRFLALGFVFLCVLGVIVGYQFRSQTYSAKAILMYNRAFQTANAEGQSFTLSEIDLTTLINTVKLPANIDSVISKLNLNVGTTAFSRKIDLELQRGSTIFSIKGLGETPKQAADIANLTVEAFLSSHIGRRKKEAQDAVLRFDEQLALLDKEHSEIVDMMEKRRREKGIGNLESEKEFYLTKKVELANSIEQSRIAIAEIDSQLEALGDTTGQDAQAFSSAAGNRQREREILDQLASQRALYTEDHPRVIQLKEELKSVISQAPSKKSRVSAGAAARAASLKRDRSEEQTRLNVFEASLTQLNEKMGQIADVEKVHGNLVSKQQNIKESIARITANKRDAEVLLNKMPEEFKVVEAARPPDHGASSKAKLVAVAVPVVGFFFLFTGVLLAEFLNSTIRTPKELKDGFGLKVLAVHVHHPDFKDSKETVKETGPYEILVSNLFANEMLKKYKTMGIISALSGSGQSTVAENICQVLGRRGSSVILVRQFSKEDNIDEDNERLTLERPPQCKSEEYELVEFSSLGQLLMKLSPLDQSSNNSNSKVSSVYESYPPTSSHRRAETIKGMSPIAVNPFKWMSQNEGTVRSSNIITHFKGSDSHWINSGKELSKTSKNSSLGYVVVDPLSLYEEPKVVELFSEIDITIVAVRSGVTQKKHLKSLLKQLESIDTIVAGVVLLDVPAPFCDDQVKMSIGKRPLSYGRDAIERALAKSLINA